MALLLPLLVLADSKIDKTISRYKRFSWYFEEGTQKERVMRHLEKTRVWKYITNPTGKKAWILSDQFPQLYYADKGLRLEHTKTTPSGVFFDKCLDVSKIEQFQYFIFLNDYKGNPCYDKILETSTHLGKIEGFNIYKRMADGKL